MAKMGRPIIKIDWEEVTKLCHIQCLQEEIANWFNCSLNTIERACKRENKITFGEFYAQKREGGKISLRRQLFQNALKNGKAELIFACKNYLAMRDIPKEDYIEAISVANSKRVYKVTWGNQIESPQPGINKDAND